jgi:Holliday junction resolvase-like predicted endonuclease
VLRRGGRVVVVEVKEKRGDRFGDPLEMIGPEKTRRVLAAARAWLASQPDLAALELVFEAAGVRGRHVERVPLT